MKRRRLGDLARSRTTTIDKWPEEGGGTALTRRVLSPISMFYPWTTPPRESRPVHVSVFVLLGSGQCSSLTMTRVREAIQHVRSGPL